MLQLFQHYVGSDAAAMLFWFCTTLQQMQKSFSSNFL